MMMMYPHNKDEEDDQGKRDDEHDTDYDHDKWWWCRW